MKIKDRNIADLRAAEYNPRRLTQKQYKELKASMVELGNLQPAVVNTYKGRENVIISGHQRIKIAKHLGMKMYPCLEVSFDPAKEKRANLRLNKNLGEWDFDILANEFDMEDLRDVGFTEKDLRIDGEGPLPGEADGSEKDGAALAEKSHVLIWFHPDKQIEIQDHLDALGEVEGVELDWKAVRPKKVKSQP